MASRPMFARAASASRTSPKYLSLSNGMGRRVSGCHRVRSCAIKSPKYTWSPAEYPLAGFATAWITPLVILVLSRTLSSDSDGAIVSVVPRADHAAVVIALLDLAEQERGRSPGRIRADFQSNPLTVPSLRFG